ncbi:MAG: PASTA domain-containing protein [Firmicutes bacterium]|nr:PASTA domain-containing protein [Bacillota bacterium]
MTKKIEDEELEKKPKSKYIAILFFIIALVSSTFLIYELFLLSGIEDLIRYIIIGLLGFTDLILLFKTKKLFKNKIKKKKNKKKPKPIRLIIFMVIYSLICSGIGYGIYNIYGKVNSINKVFITYSSNLITMSKNDATKIDDIKDYKIGILSDKKSAEGYIIPQEIIKKYDLKDNNKIKKYDDYSSMLADLYASDLDAMFVPSGYVSMFSSITGYEDIEHDTKIIISKEKKMRKSDSSSIETESSGKSIKEPFTILLMGIDSTDEVLGKNAIANGDTLILITFNPKTLNATMLSIPRDSYVPIACWPDKAENKITHAAGYGTDCMINTIEEFFDVNIDYYAKINFKGLVKLVDAVGGVDVDVPKQLCTDDSSRSKEICINPGRQHLNGEQALVFARNRKQLANGDFGRAEHQQIIVKELVNKMKSINNVSKFMEILDTISNSLDTNLTTKQILSFYNIGKDIVKKSLAADDADLVNIETLYLSGIGQMIYDKRARMTLWDYVPYKGSKKEIIRAMKENLELVDHKEIKTFSFSINEPYEKEVIGKGTYTETTVSPSKTTTALPDFTGDTEATARATANRLGIRVTFRGSGGRVISQNYYAGTDLSRVGTLVLTLSGNETTKKAEITEEETEEKEPTETPTETTDTPSTDTPQPTTEDSNDSTINSRLKQPDE